jgi:hypothetical protein
VMRRGVLCVGGSWARWVCVLVVVGVGFGCFGGGVAWGVVGGARVVVGVSQLPTRFSEGDDQRCSEYSGETAEEWMCDTLDVTATNLGSVGTSGGVVIDDTLPAGLRVAGVNLFWAINPLRKNNGEAPSGVPVSECVVEGVPVTVKCELPSEVEVNGVLVKTALAPLERLEAVIRVKVASGAVSGEVNRVGVFEGGVQVASSDEGVVVDSLAPAFGPAGFSSPVPGVDGSPDVQAGDHPFGLSTTVAVNTRIQLNPESTRYEPTSVNAVRDVVVDLPVGFLGSAVAAPKCTFGELETVPSGCPADTRVGHLTTEPPGTEHAGVNSPVFNMVPRAGVLAEFGFVDLLSHTHVIVASLAPTPEGYVARAVAREVPNVPLADAISAFYGDPAKANAEAVAQLREEEILKQTGAEVKVPVEEVSAPVGMFTNPADCSGQGLQTKVYLDSWDDPGVFNADGTPEVQGAGWSTPMVYESPPVTGCDRLRFDASLSALPETTVADSSTGLAFELSVPQNEEPGKLATPPLRDARVRMPAGLVLNPSAASGLEACTSNPGDVPGSAGNEIGWEGGTVENFSEAAPSCPAASKVGSVEVASPLLEKPVVGSVFLAAQDENPLGAVLAAYIVVDDPTTGLIVKVPGKLETDPGTGQVTGVFDESPQTPFSDFKLRFTGGERGVLSTPEACATYTTNGTLTPWSAPQSGPAVNASSSFQVNQGCAPGFSPAFAAGTTSPQAGGYSPFVLSFARQDNEQEISGLTVALPPGLSAKIAGVAKCPQAALEAAANNPSGASEQANPSCPASSEIGTVQASSGTGGQPLTTTGKAYLTGPYKGAPLGIAVIVPALAGPFDLGNVVVRTALYIDPNDAHATAVSDPFPTIIDAATTNSTGEIERDGFPIRMRQITITLSRAGYVLNPTNCNVMAINATFTSTTATTSLASSRFQAGGCRELPFNPGFQVSTQGHASKAAGASLHVRVTSAPGEANFAKTKVTLPKQLPSWLPTLQKACLDTTFNTNPAACPPGSLVGTATATSPLITTPFTGPAYLVSHGAAAFPDLEIVLQSEDITIILDGHTDIKKGITTSTFETIPDQPVTTFELTLPMGTNHVLATNIPEKLNHNLCTQKLTMPTTLTSQNNITIKRTTKITITGCTKTKKTKHKTKHTTKHHTTTKTKH